MQDPNIILDHVSKIIKRFLKENGGYSNGYNTCVTGNCQQNVHQSLNWATPTAPDLTLREIKSRGYKLNDEISEYLKEQNCYNTIYIEAIPKEHGCFDTVVAINLCKHVDINDI